MNVEATIQELAAKLIASAQTGPKAPYKEPEGYARNTECRTCGGAILFRDKKGISRTCDPCFSDWRRPKDKGIPGADPDFELPRGALGQAGQWLKRQGRKALAITGHLVGTRTLAAKVAAAAEKAGNRYAIADILSQCPLGLYDETEQVARWEVSTRALRRADLMVITGVSPMLRGRQAKELAQLLSHAANESRAVVLVGDLPAEVPQAKPADAEAWNLVLRELRERLNVQEVTV